MMVITAELKIAQNCLKEKRHSMKNGAQRWTSLRMVKLTSTMHFARFAEQTLTAAAGEKVLLTDKHRHNKKSAGTSTTPSSFFHFTASTTENTITAAELCKV